MSSILEFADAYPGWFVLIAIASSVLFGLAVAFFVGLCRPEARMKHSRDHGALLRRRRNEPPPLPRKCFSVRARVAGTDIQRTATFRALNASHAEALALDAFPDCFFAIATEVDAIRGFPLSAEQIALRDQLKEASKG